MLNFWLFRCSVVWCSLVLSSGGFGVSIFGCVLFWWISALEFWWFEGFVFLCFNGLVVWMSCVLGFCTICLVG